jgi:hypothetical protein
MRTLRRHSCIRYAKSSKRYTVAARKCRSDFCLRQFGHASQKNGPGKTGAIRRKYDFGRRSETKDVVLQTLDSQASETEIGKVAIAHRDAGASHQQAINDRHQAAEYSG